MQRVLRAIVVCVITFAVAGGASADVVPLSKLKRSEWPVKTPPFEECGLAENYGRPNVYGHLTPHGKRAAVRGLSTQSELADDSCQISLTAIAQSDQLVVYAARFGNTIVIATASDADPSPAEWLPITDDKANPEHLRDVGDPVQMIGTLHHRDYVVTASITQSWRDKEPLLAIAVRWRPGSK